MDMRQKYEGILDTYGHYVLIVHQKKRIRCSCWNSLNQEASKTCKFCFGLGHIPIIEKHICREKNISGDGLPKIINTFDYGDNMTPARCFYFKHNIEIEAKDLIINCQFDREGVPLLSDYYVYETTFIEKPRGDHGRIEFIKAYANLDTINMKIVVANIRKLGNRDIYNLGMRRVDNE